MGSAPSPTAAQIIKAGADFTLKASSNPVGAYASVLTLDTSKLTAQLPSQGASVQSGGAVGVLTPSTLAANAAAVMATYSEVGYLYIGAGAYRDDNWTAVDSGVGDCITNTANNDHLSDTMIDGKYGCSIGNKAQAVLGRFVPDHFDTVIPPSAVMPCPVALLATGQACPAAGFVYSGQPFPLTVTARNLAGKATLNYSGVHARDVTLEAWSKAGSITSENVRNPSASPTGNALTYASASVQAGAFAQGVATSALTYTFPTRYPATGLAAPTDIYLRAHENIIVSASDVTSARPAPLTSVEAGIKVVSGRLHIANNYGSELLAVPIKVDAQYWNGTRFVNSTTDQKTSFVNLNVKRSNCKRSLSAGGNCIPMTITAPVTIAAPVPLLNNGEIRLVLAAPGSGHAGSVDLSINMFDWLPSTTARIGTGIYKAGPVIYMREAY
jgi:MSHA biogenesis protein MshQ